MRKWLLYCIATIFCVGTVHSQVSSLRVSINKDTIAADEILVYEVTLENMSGQISLPNFKDFIIVSGPNTSSSFSMMNGEVTQSKSYTIYLRPIKTGELSIDAPVCTSASEQLEGQTITVYVALKGANRIDDPGNPVGAAAQKQKTSSSKRVLKKI